ncbi:hypothetical protein Ancab_017569 [Ancistrocladus abbreviatus]
MGNFHHLSTLALLCTLLATNHVISCRAQNASQVFLDTHNTARAQVGVPPLVWNLTLVTYAQDFADKVKVTCNSTETSGGPYGENTASGYEAFTTYDAVNQWIGEKPNYDHRSNECLNGTECKHYTQGVPVCCVVLDGLLLFVNMILLGMSKGDGLTRQSLSGLAGYALHAANRAKKAPCNGSYRSGRPYGENMAVGYAAPPPQAGALVGCAKVWSPRWALVVCEYHPSGSVPSEHHISLPGDPKCGPSQGRVGPMAWDDKLAAYAQKIADSVKDGCVPDHSGGPYGENVATGYGAESPLFAVNSWVEEENYYDYASNTCLNRQDCRHYTQVVWRGSVQVGCASATCGAGWPFQVCEYDPPGNDPGQRPC